MTNKVASFNKMLLLLFLMFFDFKKKIIFVIINGYSTAVVYNVITGLNQEKPFYITYVTHALWSFHALKSSMCSDMREI